MFYSFLGVGVSYHGAAMYLRSEMRWKYFYHVWCIYRRQCVIPRGRYGPKGRISCNIPLLLCLIHWWSFEWIKERYGYILISSQRGSTALRGESLEKQFYYKFWCIDNNMSKEMKVIMTCLCCKKWQLCSNGGNKLQKNPLLCLIHWRPSE